MVDIDFDVDEASIQSTIETLKRRLEDGMEEGLNDTLEAGKKEAEATVTQRRRPFTTPHLHNSFDTHTIGSSTGFITNPLEYAAYIDQGVSGTQRPRDTPFAYTDSMPPLEEMIKFVKERMGGWDLDDDLGDYNIPSGGDFPEEDFPDDNETNKPFGEKLGNDDNLTIIEDNPEDDIQDFRYTTEFDTEDPANFEEYDSIKYENERGSVSSGTINEVTDEYVEFSGIGTYRYYFGDNDVPNNWEDDIRNILAIKEEKSISDYSVGDEILIDVSNIPDWDRPDSYEDNELVFAKVDEVNEKFGNLTIHDLQGVLTDHRLSLDSRSDRIFVSKDSNPQFWKLRGGINKGAKIEIENDRGNTGTIYASEDIDLDLHYKFEKESLVPHIKNIFNGIRPDGYESIRNIDNDYNYYDQFTKTPAYDASSKTNVNPINDIQKALDNAEKGDRFFAYHHRLGKKVEVAYKADYSGTHEFTSRISPFDSLNFDRLVYDNDSTTNRDNPIDILGKLPNPDGGFDNNSSVEGGNRVIWYGQNIKFEHEGETRVATVADWDNETIEIVGDSKLDEIPAYPKPEANAKLVDGESWQELTEDEKLIQLKNQFKYAIQKSIESEKFVNTFEEFLEKEFFTFVRDKEQAREIIHNLDVVTDQTTIGQGGAINGLLGSLDNTYGLQISLDGDALTFSKSTKNTLEHEFTHAIFQARAYRTSNKLTHYFDFKKSARRPGEYPIAAYDKQGNFDQDLWDTLNKLTDDDIVNHGDIGEILYSKDDSVIGSDHLDLGINTNYEPVVEDKITFSDPQTNIETSDLFDPDPKNINVGDILKFNIEDQTKEVVFTGRTRNSVSITDNTKQEYADKLDSITEDNLVQWLFVDEDGNEIHVTVDENGNSVFKPELEAYESTSKDSDWYKRDEKFVPKQDNKIKNLAEVVNYSLRKQHAVFGPDFADNERHTALSHRVALLRGYASSNASELTAAVTEMVRARKRNKALQLIHTYDAHPELVEQHLKIFNPTEEARKIIKSDIPELQKYL